MCVDEGACGGLSGSGVKGQGLTPGVCVGLKADLLARGAGV